MDWQPIDTAPKDRTPILGVQVYEWGPIYSIVWWTAYQNSKRGSWHSYRGVQTPTHWMPLPAPPTTTA